jgi:hypothetical protein
MQGAEDRLSKLPDDILLTILEQLKTIEAYTNYAQ